VQAAQGLTCVRDLPELIRAGRPRDAREVDFQELAIGLAIFRAVQHAVNVVKSRNLIRRAALRNGGLLLKFFVKFVVKIDTAGLI